ncbi:hypothetical protein ABPG72_002346 [Tetrahymena utriculariae]
MSNDCEEDFGLFEMEMQPFEPPSQGFFGELENVALEESWRKQQAELMNEQRRKASILVKKPLIAVPRNQIECESTFFLYGEIFVSANYQDDLKCINERSRLNQFCKPVLRQEYKKRLKLIEQQLGTSMIGLNNYEGVFKFLLSKGDNLLYEVVHWLQQQRDSFKKYRQNLQRIQSEQIQLGKYEEFIQFCNKRFEGSLEICYNFLEQISPCCYYDFKIGRINYESLNFEIINSGVSESFLALIGTTVEGFSQITQRRGRTILFTAKSRIDILIAELKAMSVDGCSCPEPVDIEVLSFDGFKIPCKAVYKHIHPNPHMHILKYDEVLIVREYVVPENIISQIMYIRNKRNKHPEQIIYEGYTDLISDDFQYSVESQLFLEKYYPHIAKKYN